MAQAAGTNEDLTYGAADRPAYYDFFRRLLALSRDADAAGEPFTIRNFTHGLGRIIASQATPPPAFLEDASAPLRCLNIDVEGHVTTFYAGLGRDVEPNLYGDGVGLSLGNILTTSLASMAASVKLQKMMADFRLSTASCRVACDYASVCPGGFELTQRAAFEAYSGKQTPECIIAVRTLTDAILDDIDEHLAINAP